MFTDAEASWFTKGLVISSFRAPKEIVMPPKSESVQKASALRDHLAVFRLYQPEAVLMVTPQRLAWRGPLGLQHAVCRQMYQKGHPTQAAPAVPTVRTYPVQTPSQILPVPWARCGTCEKVGLGTVPVPRPASRVTNGHCPLGGSCLAHQGMLLLELPFSGLLGPIVHATWAGHLVGSCRSRWQYSHFAPIYCVIGECSGLTLEFSSFFKEK